MLQLFRQNTIATAIAIILVAFLAKFKYLGMPPIAHTRLGNGFIIHFPFLDRWYQHHTTWYVFLSILLLLIIAMYCNNIVSKDKLLGQKNYFPALLFILTTSVMYEFNVLNMAMIANMVLLSNLDKCISLYHASLPRRKLFDIGIFASIATMLYFPSILFIPFFLLFALVLRSISIKDVSAYLLGLALPWLFYFSLGYISRKSWWYKENFIDFSIQLPASIPNGMQLLLVSILFIALFVYALYMKNKLTNRFSISIRKKWSIIMIYLFVTIPCGIVASQFPSYPWILFLTPFSILLSYTFLHHKEKYNIFTIYLFIAVLVCIQWLL